MAAAGRLMAAASRPTTLDMGPGAGALGPKRLRSTCSSVRMAPINADVCFPSEKHNFLSPGLPGLVFLKRNINWKFSLRKTSPGSPGAYGFALGVHWPSLGPPRAIPTLPVTAPASKNEDQVRPSPFEMMKNHKCLPTSAERNRSGSAKTPNWTAVSV